MGQYMSSPRRRKLKTLPPFCAMPIVSALITGISCSIAVAAMSFDVRTIP